MKILCIDDEITAIKLYKKCMEQFSEEETYFTQEGKEAISLIEKHHFDLVITDMFMPEISGLDVMRSAKKKDPLVDIIMVTGQASFENAIDAMREGARDYLQKPINIPLLVEKILSIRETRSNLKNADDLRFANQTLEEELISASTEYEKIVINVRKTVKEIESELKKCSDLSQNESSKILQLIKKLDFDE